MNPPMAAAKLPALKPGEFRFVTKALAIGPADGTSGPRRFRTIASSTIKDLGNDQMKLTALEDMAQSFRRGVNIFLNHKYVVPEDVFGRSDSAEIRESGEVDDKTGEPIWDLHIGGVVNEPNPRAGQLADSMEGGYVTFGTSVGAIVKSHQRNKDGGMDIEHVDCKEGSIVGIPMNQRSWTQKAVKAATALDDAEVAGTGLPEDDEDETDEPKVASAAEVVAPAEPIVTDMTTEPEIEAVKSDMSAETRNDLADGDFACPEKRKYPINDKAHVRAALSRIADPSNDQCGRDKIIAAARRMGIGEHGDEQKAWTDDELLTWAVKSVCPDCGGSAADPEGDCANAMHTHASSDTDNDGDNPAAGDDPDHDGKSADAVLDAAAIKSETTEGGQEADPAATPETAPPTEDATVPAIEQKALFPAEDVVELVKRVGTLVETIGSRDESIVRLREELDAVKGERDRLAAEIPVMREQVEAVMKMPLRQRAVEHVTKAVDRLAVFDPEVAATIARFNQEKSA